MAFTDFPTDYHPSANNFHACSSQYFQRDRELTNTFHSGYEF